MNDNIDKNINLENLEELELEQVTGRKNLSCPCPFGHSELGSYCCNTKSCGRRRTRGVDANFSSGTIDCLVYGQRGFIRNGKLIRNRLIL